MKSFGEAKKAAEADLEPGETQNALLAQHKAIHSPWRRDSVTLLEHPPLPLHVVVVASIVMERERQQNDSLADG